MYEQRTKNINKASADTIYCLAKALGCTMKDLIEKMLDVMEYDAPYTSSVIIELPGLKSKETCKKEAPNGTSFLMVSYL